MSKSEKTNLWLKQHYKCVIAWLVVVLIALIVVMSGNDKELAGYFSFACSLSGILLAMVVIIHTWIDSADTRNVLTEVKSHLTDIRGDVGKQAEALDLIKNSDMLKNIYGQERQSDATCILTEQPIQISQTESFPFRLSNLRLFPLFCLYSAGRFFQSGKEVVLLDYLNNSFTNDLKGIKDKDKEYFLVTMSHAFKGILLMFEGMAGIDEVHWDDKIIKINTFPTEMISFVENEFNKKLEVTTNNLKLKQYISRVRLWKDFSDVYFTAS